MNKRSLLSLAVAASLAHVATVEAQTYRDIKSLQSLVYASEIDNTTATLKMPGDQWVRINVPLPDYTIKTGNSMFIKVNLLNGATFAESPKIMCRTANATTTAQFYSASPQLGGANSDAVTMPIVSATEFKVDDNSDTGCYFQISSAGIKISGVTNKTISAVVEYKDGASDIRLPYQGTLISFNRGLEDNYSKVGTKVVIDVATSSTKFTTNTVNGTDTAMLGKVSYEPASTTARVISGGAIATTAFISAATVNIAGLLLGAVNSGATVFLDTGSCTNATYTGGSASSGSSTFTISFSNVESTALAKGVNACITIDGNAKLEEGQITATITNPIVKEASNYTARIFNTNNNLAVVEKNGDEAIALVIPRPGGADRAFIRITNLSTQTGRVLGTLYHQDGTLLGTANIILSEAFGPNEVLILNSETLATQMGVADGSWTSGRAFLKIEAEVSDIGVQNLIRSPEGTLTNMSAGVATQ